MNAICDAPPTGAPLLEMRGISKSFPGVKALDDVSFSVYPGEVHMLLGENGAGKSSLMKVLCGVYVADAGEFHYKGQPVAVASPADTMRLGIAVIFQEFSLVPYLNIAQNIFLGREPRGWLPGSVDHKAMHAEARRLLDLLGMDLPTHTLVHELGVAQQQMIEIAKALSQNARILVLDEPTAALSDRETERLFEVIGKLKADGVSLIYISHRMAEVFALGDRITVMRDGRKVGSYLPGDATPDELVARMVGRKVDMTYQRTRGGPTGELALEVRGVSAANGIEGIDLNVRAGEIVGLAGLVGSGRSEVARAIFGADAIREGEIRIFGKPMTGGPEKARALGAALIPESRKTEGLALIRTVRDNLMLAGLGRAFPARWYSGRKADVMSAREIERLRIATPNGDQLAQNLSGGNQQKIVIGKWLLAESKLFIFDEPTRGIDVGAKAEIFALIDGLVKDGAAVLLISSELPEIVNVCDRTYVMREGRIAGELDYTHMTEESVLQLGMNDA
ncbi:sugar ABC transporter ATP-binding protein [Cupriavidus plantarum]|uniref:sugar ABC transporter ATP-binding protein n=1 Tax=Cupriavidus plantarum TaxID=942865 RepID=UPI000EB16EBD|nr:sugar ABC transporter ATP-binding protein [Cupriavidus plantarum]RLK31849.1 monosaccharide ABC transporter ATP-binding protein (CUT2 family) [Cupriavidus plantarum]